MKLGFVTAILHDLNLEEVLKFAAEEGYSCVEVMSWPVGKAERKYAGVTHIDSTNLTQAQADDLNALARNYIVEFSALGYYPNLLVDDAETAQRGLEHLKKVMQAARLLGLNTVNTFIGADHQRNTEHNFAKFQKIWPDIIRFAEDQGIRIGIENCPMLFTNDEWPSGKNLGHSPAIWRRMFEAIPSKNFGLNYDPSHFIWQMMDYIQPIYEFKDRIFHAHAKDLKINYRKLNDEGILALGWSTPKIPGYGQVNWGQYCSALSDIGYTGPVCVEVEDDAFGKTLEGRKRSLKVSRNVLSPYFV